MNQPRCGPAIVDFNSKSLQVAGVENTLVHICREVVMAVLFRDIVLWLHCCTRWIRSRSTWKTGERASSKYQNQKKKKWNCWASHHSESFAVSDSSSLRRRLRCAFSPYSVSWAAALSHWQTDGQTAEALWCVYHLLGKDGHRDIGRGWDVFLAYKGRAERAGTRFTAGHQSLFSREQRVKPLAEPGRQAEDCHRWFCLYAREQGR